MPRAATRTLLSVALLTLCPVSGPAVANPYSESCRAAEARPKKKGFGLGGLLGAARHAGVGDVLGAGMLGDRRAAQTAGAVADIAAEAVAAPDPTAPARACAAASRERRARD